MPNLRCFLWIIAIALAISTTVRADEAPKPDPKTNDLIAQAVAALQAGKAEDAVKLSSQAIERSPKSIKGLYVRGTIFEYLRKHAEAIADFTAVIGLEPKAAEAYDHRGSEQFKLGKIEESIKDFDEFLKLKPDLTERHWKRGISYYYAGRYADGRKQFEQSYKLEPDDVENAVWHFLCVARADGAAQAKAKLFKQGDDKRVPLPEVYGLFAGTVKPDAVLAAARAGKPGEEELNERLFYAHLYLGLYAEALGDEAGARDHLQEAEKHGIGHYMWDVAHVHNQRLNKTKP